MRFEAKTLRDICFYGCHINAFYVCTYVCMYMHVCMCVYCKERALYCGPTAILMNTFIRQKRQRRQTERQTEKSSES